MCYNSYSVNYFFTEYIKSDNKKTNKEILGSFKSMKTNVTTFNNFEDQKRLRKHESVRA